MMEGGVGIKLGMINLGLLKDYLEVWWTILSCAIALGRFSFPIQCQRSDS